MDNYNESTWSSHLTIQTFCREAICSWNAQKVKASNPFWISKILLLREWDGMDQVTDYSFRKPSVHKRERKKKSTKKVTEYYQSWVNKKGS